MYYTIVPFKVRLCFIAKQPLFKLLLTIPGNIFPTQLNEAISQKMEGLFSEPFLPTKK